MKHHAFIFGSGAAYAEAAAQAFAPLLFVGNTSIPPKKRRPVHKRKCKRNRK